MKPEHQFLKSNLGCYSCGERFCSVCGECPTPNCTTSTEHPPYHPERMKSLCEVSSN